jgi:hypothetical protein
MRRKPGPRKKLGDRYPSGDLKPVIPPALWGRVRDLCGDPRFNSVFGRLWLHGEVTDAQAAAGFLIADIYRSGDFEEASKGRTGVTTAGTGVGPNASQRDRKELDDLLSVYPPKVRNGLIELCVLNRTVDWELRPQIRRVLDHVATQLAARNEAPPTSARMRRRRESSNQASEGTKYDCDPDVEAFKKVIAVLRPDLDADGKGRVIDHFVGLRDREEFRQKNRN